MGALWELRRRLTPRGKGVWLWLTLACALTGLVWSWLTFLLERQSIRIAFRSMLYPKFWFTALLFFCLTAFFTFLTNHLLAGGLLSGLPFTLLGLVNTYKLAIAGVPLTLNDLALAGKLGAIVELNAQSLAPSRNTVLTFVGMLLWSLLLWFFDKPLALPRRRGGLLAALAPLAVLVTVFWFALDPLILTPVNRAMEAGTLSQSLVNSATGFPVGMIRSLRFRVQFIRPVSDAQLKTMLDQAQTELGSTPAPDPDAVHPNILLILSESFFDVTELKGVTYRQDPIPEYHALQKEGVSGHFHTRSLGYGTCNVELELLTGINTRLTYDEELATAEPQLLDRLPAVPRLLKNAGYQTTMLHLYNDSIYNREPRMEAIGFEGRYFSGDLAALDPKAPKGDDYWVYMAGKLSGKYYSDAYMSELLIDLYEAKPQGQPLFAYAISMENHTPYDAGKYDQLTVSCSAPISDQALEMLTTASQGCANASQALASLCDYFRTQDEPTVILFFGDHRPGLSIPGGEGVYTQLYAAQGAWNTYATVEQVAEMRTANYLIWANDPSLLPARPGTWMDTSSNYFGLSILDAARVQKPLYWRMLEQLRQTRLIDTMEYAMSADGTPAWTPPAKGTDHQRLYRMGAVLRRTLYGENPYAQRLWQ